jgi:hypothetical protein
VFLVEQEKNDITTAVRKRKEKKIFIIKSIVEDLTFKTLKKNLSFI